MTFTARMADTPSMMLTSSLHFAGRSYSITFHSDPLEDEPVRDDQHDVIGQSELADPAPKPEAANRMGFRAGRSWV